VKSDLAHCDPDVRISPRADEPVVTIFSPMQAVPRLRASPLPRCYLAVPLLRGVEKLSTLFDEKSFLSDFEDTQYTPLW